MPGVLAGIAIALGLAVATAYEGVDPLLTLYGLANVAGFMAGVWVAERLGV
jgi:hypothetical protein